MLDKAQQRMTPEEFYAWQEGMDERYELVDGYPVPRCPDIEMMPGASKRHDRIVWTSSVPLELSSATDPARALPATPRSGPRRASAAALISGSNAASAMSNRIRRRT